MNTISVEEVKAKYNKDYRDRKFGGPDYTHKWILGLIGAEKGKRLLDIGCGQGLLLKEAERIGLSAYGIDISSEAAEIARRNSPGSNVVCDDGQKLSWWSDAHFDYVTAIGTIEHFLDPAASLLEIRRVMKENAVACIMLPNLHYYRHVINKVLWKKEPTSYQPIERFASYGEWKKMIEDSGLKIVKVYKYNKFNRGRLLRFIRAVTVPLHLSHHFVFICRKK